MYKHKSAFFSHSKGVYVSKKKIWEKKKKKKFSKEKISVKPKKRDIKALSKLGLPLNPDLVAGLAIPVVFAVVGLGMRRLRRNLTHHS